MTKSHPFAETLRAVNERLDLPVGVRRSVLLELAADLEAMRDELVSRGMLAAEAHARALEFVDLNDRAVHELARVHGGLLRRGMESISQVARGRLERTALVLVVLALVQLALTLSGEAGVLRLAGFPGWLSMLASSLTLLLGGVALYRHRARGDHRPASSRPLLRRIHALTLLQVLLLAAGLVLGAVELGTQLNRAPGAELALVKAGRISPGLRQALLVVHASMARMALGAFGLTLSFLLWQRLAQQACTLEDAQLELLRELGLEPRSPFSLSSPSSPLEVPCSN